MDTELTMQEVRVLGALVEKKVTTPDYYPLSLNALTNACNQKSNREPVVDFDESTVVRALDGLRAKGLVNQVSSYESRVPKYEEKMEAALQFTAQELAVVCVLMLRGPQTIGEIRGRCHRLYEFEDLGEVEVTMEMLADRADGPLVMKLPLQPGRKEPRFAHLLSGEPEISIPTYTAPPEAARLSVEAENERIEALESQVEELKAEIESLKEAFAGFKAQFE